MKVLRALSAVSYSFISTLRSDFPVPALAQARLEKEGRLGCLAERWPLPSDGPDERQPVVPGPGRPSAGGVCAPCSELTSRPGLESGPCGGVTV